MKLRLRLARFFRFSLRLKLFFIMAALVLLPMAILSYVLLENQYQSVLDQMFEKSLDRMKLIGHDLQNKLTEQLTIPGATEVVSRGYSDELTSLPAPETELLKAAEQTEAEPLLVLYTEGEEQALRLMYATSSGPRWRYTIFNANFLRDLLLDNDNIDEQETFFLSSLAGNGLASNQIEQDFKVPPKWLPYVKRELPLDQIVEIKVAEKLEQVDYLLIKGRLGTFPAVAIIAVREADLLGPIISSLWQQIYLLGFIALVTFGFASVLARSQIKPLQNILSMMQKMAKHDYSMQLSITATDERRNIFRFINQIKAKLKRYHDINVERIIKHERKLRAELEYAQKVQKLFLPEKVQPIAGLDYAYRYIPYISVGGDYIDIIHLNENLHAFALADVTGHGIQASLKMTILKVLLGQALSETYDVEEVLKRFNRSAHDLLPGLTILPFIFVLYDSAKRLLYLANCGSPSLITGHSSDGVDYNAQRSTVIGINDELTPKIQRFEVRPGDFFFAYSDGITDVVNPEIEDFGDERLLSFMQKNTALSSDDLSLALEQELKTYAGGEDYPDDITWFVIKVT